MMADVLCNNAFLKETPLTSTKNKFILEPESRNLFCDEFTINSIFNMKSGTAVPSRKRKLHSSYFESLTKENALTSTLNKFLPKPPLLEKKGVCSKKKKKKKLAYRSARYLRVLAESRSRSRSREISESDFDELDAAPDGFSADRVAIDCLMKRSADRLSTKFLRSCARKSAPATGSPAYSPASPSYCAASPEYISYRDTDFPESERIIPPEPSACISAPLSAFAENMSHNFLSEDDTAIPESGRGGNMNDSFLFGAASVRQAPMNLRKRSGARPQVFGAFPKMLNSAMIRPPTLVPDLFNMPAYNFASAEEFKAETFESFSFVDAQASLLQLERARCVKSKKMQFLNITSMALIYNSNLKNTEDIYRVTIQKYADEVKTFDPEFILKVALFSRQELHIRSASNFLLSYAAYHEETRPYLEKYFESCIRLPSDWMEVADLYQVFSDSRLKNRSLPSALKKVMAKSFSKFDEYQLAKYNREKKASQTKGFTLKQLIRLLHLDSPANEIMCLIGKKYPETAEAFRKSKLPGIWDSRRAGQRMKLPVPETWETQISAHGNKPEIWEQLIDHSKLPYMAMLRNLRNVILSGISQKHHEKVLKHLKSKGAVINSRQSPLQFFEAFKILEDIKDAHYLRHVYRDSRIGEPQWKKARRNKIKERASDISIPLVCDYEEAVSEALEISALHNLQPIPGKSLVICDILFPSSLENSKKNKVYNLCIMMGLMCLKACEDCKMNVICGSYSDEFELSEYSFCQSIKNACAQYENQNENATSLNSEKAMKSVLEYYLKQHVILREKVDHVIVLRASGSDGGEEVKGVIKSFLHKYREVVNPELLYTDVDFLMSNSSLADSDSADGKDVYLGGNATQLVKFIAERSSGGQLTYVENIDLKYELQTKEISKKCKKPIVLPEQEKVPILTKVPKWHTVRIFISSTFKDMHSERDLLIRYVIPELRKRAASVFVKINEVDLRWGITETDCASKRAAELCLLEAQKSDLFIGMLGERYGTIFNYDPPDSPELQWVKDYPRGLSITELEMHAGALRADKLLKKKAFFYIRNSTCVNLIPEKYKSNFESEDSESKEKVEALKSKIRSSGLKVYDGYPCHFAGVLDGKPVLSGLDNFGKTVLIETWNAIKEMHEQDPYADDVMEEEMCQQALLHSFDSFVEVKNSPAENLMKEIEKQCGIFLITGNPGSGKTTFVVDLLQRLKNFTVIKFFVGLSPRSTELSYMLQYISNSIARTFPVSSVFPKLTSDVMNHFPDILQEAVNSTGNADFVLVIDGLDHLSADDQLLDWLPLNLPQGLRLICSASDSSYAFKVLNERHIHGAIVHVNLPGINQFDRENITRQYLRLYGKSLDESSFNNQMLLLVTKKDSGIPLYLRIACDYLRSYASFDNFMSTLQSLPSSMPLLFQEIILQMENEYGSVLVQTMFTLLSITKEGLDDADLHTLLSLVSLEKEKRSFLTFDEAIHQLKKLGPDNMLSQVTYCSLMHAVSSFAFGHCRFKKFSLIGSEFEKAVKKYYLNKNYSNFSKYMHCILAAYYFVTCDSEDNGTWKGRSGSAFRGLIFHLFYGSCFQELADYLCCLQFLETAFSVEASDLLLEYYSLLFEERRTGSSEALRKIDFPLLSSFYDFVARNLHIFQIYPDLVMQQALNEPSDSLVKLNLQKDLYKSPVVECLSVYDNDPRIATLRGFFKNITSASCQKVSSRAFLGSEDGYLKVLDFPSKKIIRSVKSHSSAITFICSAGKDRICTASTDTTLSIWSTVDYSRISVLKGHKHIVSCCCADASSTILLSSGWDNSVRLWSLRDGSSISVIDFRCPVNCIDHHPTKQQVACGLWSGNVEIWDTVSLEKQLTLSSSCSSVKSIVYTLDGLNLITSYMNSDVTIWSSEQGLKISCLKGHVLPVKSISYSPEGDKIISGSDDCTLKVWPAESGLSVRTFSECKFFPISVLQIITPNHLAVGYQNSDIWVMDMDTGFVTTKMSLEADLVSCFSRFDPLTYASKNTEENWVDLSVVFGTKSGKIMVGNLRTSEITTVGTINARITAIIHNVRVIVCGSSEGDIGLFSYPDMNSKIVTGAHGGSVTALNLFARDENVWVITAGSDKVIKLWEIDYEELVMKEEFFSKHYDYVTCCSSYPDCVNLESYLTGSHDNNIISQNKFCDKTVYEGLKTSVVNIASTDKYVLGCGSDGSVAMWSEEGTLLSYISGVEQSSVVLSFRVDKDISGEFDITLAFVDRDGSVKIRKPNQRSFSYSLEGHNRGITSCCTSQNGEILSCSLDGTVNLWKIPEQTEDSHPEHLASITDICLSVTQNEVVSSDAYGNVVIWKLTLSADVPLMYAGKKTYTGGFVKALSLLQDKKLVCAVTQTADGGDKHFIDVLYFDCSASDNNSIYNFQVKNSHYLDSEVLCLDASLKTETVVVGLKSGNFVIITSDMKKTFNISDDWVLGVKLSSHSVDSAEFIFTSLLNGTVKRIETEEALKNVNTIRTSMEEIQCPDLGNIPVFISAFCCSSFDIVYCGDSQGWLRRYSSAPISKKIHGDSITGIAVCGRYVFTCSLDKTLKGWNSALNQVCLFHSSVPITSLVGCEMVLTSSVPTYILVIGTSSGAIQLLKFHDKQST